MIISEDFEENFRTIQQKFLIKLKYQIIEFTKFIPKLDKVDIKKDIHELEHIRTQLHQLAGSSRTFGFSDLNDHAEKTEYYINKIMTGTPVQTIHNDLKKSLLLFIIEAKKSILHHLNTKKTNKKTTNKKNTLDNQRCFNILSADDDAMFSKLLKLGLKSSKYRLTQFINGRKLLKFLEENNSLETIDLILLDLDMPGLNGMETLEIIKSNRELNHIPTILITTKNNYNDYINGISKGAYEYVTKPFKMTSLLNSIEKLLDTEKKHIIIADDDDLIQDLLKPHFLKLGYKVSTVNNGVDALSNIQKLQPDIILLDIAMPGMDGISVLKSMKNDKAISHIPVILLTTKNQKENILQGLQSGANDYISKPFDMDELGARVAGNLKISQGTNNA